jgi:hypothetical protein
MLIEFVIRGTSPLLCHNPQMVDPECRFNREIKQLTSKRKKTDEDLAQIERLEWLGGVYTAAVEGKPVVSFPAAKLRKCIINAGRITKQGKQVERAVVMTKIDVPLIYEGSDKAKDLEAEINRLLAAQQFRSRLSVRVGQSRVMRVRPQFFPWAAIVPAMFIPDAGLNFDDLAKILDIAGPAERIGDNRVNGYGAFAGYVREVKETTPPIPCSLAGVEKFVASKERSAS